MTPELGQEEETKNKHPFFKNYYGNPDDYFPTQIYFLDANGLPKILWV